jgi:hypothetical protein
VEYSEQLRNEMFEMRKALFFIMVFCLIIGGFAGCKVEVPTKENEKVDSKVIEDFYNELVSFNKEMKEGNSDSLTESLKLLKPVIDSFNQASGDDNPTHSEYYSIVKNHPFYKSLYKWVFEPDESIDLDSQYLTGAWKMYFSSLTDELLKIELPEDISINADIVTKTQTNDVKKRFENILKESIDGGLDMYNHSEKYTELKKAKVYSIDGGTIEFNIGFDYDKLPEYRFVFVFSCDVYKYNLFDHIYSIRFSNGNEEIDLNSNYEDNLFQGCSDIIIYSTKFDEEMNEKYKALYNLFNKNGSIKITINEDITLTLTEEDKEIAKNYFQVNELLKQIS